MKESSQEEIDDDIGELSLEEAMNLYEPMINDFMGQKLYLIDTRQDLNAPGNADPSDEETSNAIAVQDHVRARN